MKRSSSLAEYSRSSPPPGRKRPGRAGRLAVVAARSGSALIVAALIILAACTRTDPDAEPPSGTPSAGVTAAPDPSAGCAAVAAPALAGARTDITVDGEQRTYLVDAPASDADDPRPLVLAFHGFRSSAAELRDALGLAAVTRSDRAVLVYPDGHEGVELLHTTGRGWDRLPDQTRDLRFVGALLDRLERTRCIDRRRIFATGFSNGGFFANLLGCMLASRIAAVAPVGGAVVLASCAPGPPAAVLLLHGRADQIVVPAMVHAARDWWAERAGCTDAVTDDAGCTRYRGCRADVAYCEGPQAHRWPEGATARIWRFFQTHPRAAPTGAAAGARPPRAGE